MRYLFLLLLPMPAMALPVVSCEPGLLVHLQDLGQAGMIEGQSNGLCQVRLETGRAVVRAPRDLQPGIAADTPPDATPDQIPGG